MRVNTDDGGTRILPDNAADPLYEVFLGEVVELYCTDFESDPDGEGWTHALLMGDMREGADDWIWGARGCTGDSGDPDGVLRCHRLRKRPRRRQLQRQVPAQQGEHPALTVRDRGQVHQRPPAIVSPLAERGGRRLRGPGTHRRRTARSWTNLASGRNGDTHHEDKEWRFHDVDLESALTSKTAKCKSTFQLQLRPRPRSSAAGPSTTSASWVCPNRRRSPRAATALLKKAKSPTTATRRTATAARPTAPRRDRADGRVRRRRDRDGRGLRRRQRHGRRRLRRGLRALADPDAELPWRSFVRHAGHPGSGRPEQPTSEPCRATATEP